MTLYLNGMQVKSGPIQPKLARELKIRINDLLDRYGVEEVLGEIVRQKPKLDNIHVGSAVCPQCGAEVE